MAQGLSEEEMRMAQEFLQQPAAQPQPAAQGAAAPTELSVDELRAAQEFLGQTYDENLQDTLPVEVSGISPNTPKNVSPLEPLDRLKLSVANKKGKRDFLYQKYGEENVKINTAGDFVVKQGDSWHLIDPEGLGGKDPWELSKLLTSKGRQEAGAELLGELADNAPELVGIGLGIATGGAALAAVGGASAAGGTLAGVAAAGGIGAAESAAIAATRTSLGRVIGTYQATPEEQFGDIAFETLIGMGGGTLNAGIKPTARTMSKMMPKIVKEWSSAVKEGGKKALSAGPNAVKAAGRQLAKYSVGEDAFNTMVEQGDELTKLMKDIAVQAGDSPSRLQQTFRVRSRNEAKNIALNAQPTMTSMYKGFTEELMGAVDDTFDPAIKETTDGMLAGFQKAGLGTFTQRGKELSKEAVDSMMSQGRLPKDVVFKPYSRAQFRKLVESGTVDDTYRVLAQNDDVYNLALEMVDSVQSYNRSSVAKGKLGAKQILDFKTNIANSLQNVKQAAQAKGRNTYALESLADSTRVFADNATERAFNKVGKGELYKQRNAAYSRAKELLTTFTRAKERASKGAGEEAYESALNSIISGRKGTEGSLDEAVTLMKGFGANTSNIEKSINNLNLLEAAGRFNPTLVKGDQAGKGILGLSSLIYGGMTGNLPLIGAVLAGRAIASPTTVRATARASRVPQAAVAASWRGLNTVRTLSDGARKEMLANPRAIQSFVNVIQQSAGEQLQTEAGLQQQLTQGQAQ